MTALTPAERPEQSVKYKSPREIVEALAADVAALPADLSEDLCWYLGQHLQEQTDKVKRLYLAAHFKSFKLDQTV